MKVTKISGFYVMVIKGDLVDKQLNPAYVIGEIKTKSNAAKLLASENGLKHCKGIFVEYIESRDFTAFDLKRLYEEGEE